jgi:DNA repair exonuclease SbcCD ATPase subunit
VERRKLGQSLSRITAALRGASAEIERLDALLEICTAIGFPAQDLAELQEVASEAAEALETADDAERLRSAQDSYEELLKVIPRTFNQAVRHWRNDLVETNYRPLLSFGEMLENVENLAELGREMRACGQEAIDSTHITRIPELRDAVKRLERRFAELQAERSGKVGAIPAVGEFLTAVGERRATLALVTPSVLVWLEQNGALENFKVTS